MKIQSSKALVTEPPCLYVLPGSDAISRHPAAEGATKHDQPMPQTNSEASRGTAARLPQTTQLYAVRAEHPNVRVQSGSYRIANPLGGFGLLMATGGSFLWLGDSSLLTQRAAVSTNIVTEITCGTDARLPADNVLHKIR